MNKGNIWIRIYKILVILSFAIILFAGFFLMIDDPLLIFPVALVAGLDLVLGMLIASFFENVQVIREKLEGTNYTPNREKNTNVIGASLSSVCPECGGTFYYTKGMVETSCPWCFKKVYIIPNEQNK